MRTCTSHVKSCTFSKATTVFGFFLLVVYFLLLFETALNHGPKLAFVCTWALGMPCLHGAACHSSSKGLITSYKNS